MRPSPERAKLPTNKPQHACGLCWEPSITECREQSQFLTEGLILVNLVNLECRECGICNPGARTYLQGLVRPQVSAHSGGDERVWPVHEEAR